MKAETINALALLRAQHDEVESLIEKIESTDDITEKLELFVEMADKLAAHAAIEEQIFYPAVNAKSTRELLVESTEEHLAIKRVLADMLELDVDDEHFDAKLSVMKEQIEHHAREEEEEALFPKVERLLNTDELAALGNEMLVLFESLMEQSPRKQVPAETQEPASI